MYLHMTPLTQKEISFVWYDKNEENFQKLKILLTSASILTLPVEDKAFIVYCDTSQLGLGTILIQD